LISFAFSHSASSSGLPIVALSAMSCILGSSCFSIVISTSSVGPLPGSFSRCISSTITVFTCFSHGLWCLIRESSFSAVAMMKSFFSRYLSSLSRSPIDRFILQWFPYFFVNSLYFSVASAFSGTI